MDELALLKQSLEGNIQSLLDVSHDLGALEELDLCANMRIGYVGMKTVGATLKLGQLTLLIVMIDCGCPCLGISSKTTQRFIAFIFVGLCICGSHTH
jgi:hypothetical protein